MAHGERAEPNPPRRGQRFTLHLPVWYRPAGEAEWYAGTTENISYSGALIHAGASIAPATPVTVVIALPSTTSKPGGCLVGHGRVVRSLVPPFQSGASVFAVSVTRYELDRREHVMDTITP